MDANVSPERVAELLKQAPAWVLSGMTAPNPRLRATATDTLARLVCAKLAEAVPPTRDTAQLTLPLR